MTNAASQLYLTIDAGPAADARLAAALAGTTGIAAVLIRRGTGTLDAAAARPLVELAQKANIAVLIDGNAALARALRADGVHLRWSADLRRQFDEAREILGNRFMVGIEIAPNAEMARHDAMELAELGADYIGFATGEGTAQYDLVAWWADIFEVPCVAFDVADIEDARKFASTGAEFITVHLAAGASPADGATRIRDFATAAGQAQMEGATS